MASSWLWLSRTEITGWGLKGTPGSPVADSALLVGDVKTNWLATPLLVLEEAPRLPDGRLTTKEL